MFYIGISLVNSYNNNLKINGLISNINNGWYIIFFKKKTVILDSGSFPIFISGYPELNGAGSFSPE